MKIVIRILIIVAALSFILGVVAGITRIEVLSQLGSTRGFLDMSIASSLLSIALSTGNPFGKAEA